MRPNHKIPYACLAICCLLTACLSLCASHALIGRVAPVCDVAVGSGVSYEQGLSSAKMEFAEGLRRANSEGDYVPGVRGVANPPFRFFPRTAFVNIVGKIINPTGWASPIFREGAISVPPGRSYFTNFLSPPLARTRSSDYYVFGLRRIII